MARETLLMAPVGLQKNLIGSANTSCRRSRQCLLSHAKAKALVTDVVERRAAVS